MSETKNARVSECTLATHGRILYLQMGFEGPSWGQGLPSYDLRAYDCAAFLRAVMDTFGVDDFSKIKGQLCRVRYDNGSHKISAVGHPLEDRWFVPEQQPLTANASLGAP